MAHINKTVKHSYSAYEGLVDMPKTLLSKCIYITAIDSSNKDWRKGSGGFGYTREFESDINECGHITVQQHIVRENDYGFTARMPFFMKEPCFRFDSDGGGHFNKSPDIPLVDQYVPTPHFHMWNDSGVEIAYRTESISLHEEAISRDINLGFSLFCDEFELSLFNKTIPQIVTQLTLFPELTITDIHAGLNFD